MIINGVELADLDVYDLEVAEKFDKGLKRVAEAGKNLEGLSMPETIKVQCNAIFKFFNEFFGEGTAEKIFGDKVNLVTCLKALDEFVSQVRRQRERIEEISNKYSPNRAARRNKK